jgi:hypothetical protein
MRIPRVPGRKFAPILLAVEAAMVLRDHWGRLPAKDRRELTRILRQFQGRPGNLTARDRSELLRIVKQLDLITAGRKLLPLHGGVRKSRR